MRSKLRRKRSFLYAIVLLCAVVLGMLWVTSDTASAGTQESVRHKYFTSIEIKEGTSLWEIAQEYQTEEYDSTEDYIREVKKINHMKSDVIYEGSYLCIPYYSSENKEACSVLAMLFRYDTIGEDIL